MIAQCREGTSLALAAVDLEYLRKVRREMPVFTHRRQDVYQLPPCISRILPLPPDEVTFSFGQVTIKGWAVFYQSRHSLAFVNRKCVVPGRKMRFKRYFCSSLFLIDLLFIRYFSRRIGDAFETDQTDTRYAAR